MSRSASAAGGGRCRHPCDLGPVGVIDGHGCLLRDSRAGRPRPLPPVLRAAAAAVADLNDTALVTALWKVEEEVRWGHVGSACLSFVVCELQIYAAATRAVIFNSFYTLVACRRLALRRLRRGSRHRMRCVARWRRRYVALGDCRCGSLWGVLSCLF